MDKKDLNILILLFILIFLLIFSFTNQTMRRLLFTSRAYTNELNIKIQLQGEYEKIVNPTIKTKVVFYSQTGLVKDISGINLAKEEKNIFRLTIDTGDLDINKIYALYIKPEKYLGRLFCSSTSYSANCTSPQIIIKSGLNNLDLSQIPFLSGDIDPADGKITAEDMSKIISQIGMATTSALLADINSDHKVETVDYSLALYSLSQNAVDDSIPFIPTILSPTPTGTSTTPTLTPTSAATLTPTTALTGGGTCQGTFSGRIYVNALGSTYCNPLNNEQSQKCVNSASECTSNRCIDEIINTARVLTNFCGGSIASLDEARSRPTLNCTVNFVPGNCIPTPTPTIVCSQGPSC